VIFVGPRGIRAGWRFALFTVVSTLLAAGAQWFTIAVAGYHPHAGLAALDVLLSDAIGFATALASAALMARIERRPLGAYGLPARRDALARLGEGLAWGVLGVAGLAGLIAAAGGLSIHGLAVHGAELARWALLWAAVMLVLGLFEEFYFRGYPLATLAQGMGFWPAAILLSVLFGGLHYVTKPMETPLDALNVALVGLYLCLTIARTGSLWFAVGFHAAFDYMALVVFAAPNTGNGGRAVDGHLLDTSYRGPAWLTGGPAGIEASVFLWVVLALLAVRFLRGPAPALSPGTSGQDAPRASRADGATAPAP